MKKCRMKSYHDRRLVITLLLLSEDEEDHWGVLASLSWYLLWIVDRWTVRPPDQKVDQENPPRQIILSLAFSYSLAGVGRQNPVVQRPKPFRIVSSPGNNNTIRTKNRHPAAPETAAIVGSAAASAASGPSSLSESGRRTVLASYCIIGWVVKIEDCIRFDVVVVIRLGTVWIVDGCYRYGLQYCTVNAPFAWVCGKRKICSWSA